MTDILFRSADEQVPDTKDLISKGGTSETSKKSVESASTILTDEEAIPDVYEHIVDEDANELDENQQCEEEEEEGMNILQEILGQVHLEV